MNGSRGTIVGFERMAPNVYETCNYLRRENHLEAADSVILYNFSDDPKSVLTALQPSNIWPIVRFVNSEVLIIRKSTFSIEDSYLGEEVAARNQIPLALAWATTIHKAQGQSIDRLKVDCTGLFAFGHGMSLLFECSVWK